MLDWFSGYVGYDASQLRLGRVLLVDKDGICTLHRDRWEESRGSFESGIQVTRGQATAPMVQASKDLGFLCSDSVLRISGNPSKFLQGHNVAGPSVSQLGPVLQAMVRQFAEGLRPVDADEETLPAVQRSRLDITTAVDLGSHQAVHDYLRYAETTTRSRHGRALADSGTVYYGKHSRRWSLKMYCKHCELKKHLPHVDSGLFFELLEFTRPQLRIELTLRRPELKDRDTLDEAIIWEFLSKIEMPQMKAKYLTDVDMRPVLKLTLQSWYDGTDVSLMFPRRTFYRYRKEILQETGIDISMPRVEQADQAAPVLLGLDELREREVKTYPEKIQRSLFGSQS